MKQGWLHYILILALGLFFYTPLFSEQSTATTEETTAKEDRGSGLQFGCGPEPQLPQCVCGHNPGIFDAVDGQHNNRLRLWQICKNKEATARTCGDLVADGKTLQFRTYLQSKIANSGNIRLHSAKSQGLIGGMAVTFFKANSTDKLGENQVFTLSLVGNRVVLSSHRGDLWVGQCSGGKDTKIVGQAITREGKAFPFEMEQ